MRNTSETGFEMGQPLAHQKKGSSRTQERQGVENVLSGRGSWTMCFRGFGTAFEFVQVGLSSRFVAVVLFISFAQGPGKVTGDLRTFKTLGFPDRSEQIQSTTCDGTEQDQST